MNDDNARGANPDPRDAAIEDWKVCGVCGYPLESIGDQYLHIRADQGDHIPVPVAITDIVLNQRCDFCDREEASDIILVHDFALPGYEDIVSISHWSACGECAALVRRGRWSALITRVKQHGPDLARRTSRSFLIAYYGAVEANMYGILPIAEWRERMGYRQPGP